MRPVFNAIAILLFFSAPAIAAEAVFVDRESLRPGATPGREAKPEFLAARYLESAGTTGEAAEQMLADEQAGDIGRAQAAETFAEIADYAGRDDYRRARFISDALWRTWSVDRYNEFWLDQAARMLRDGELKAAEKALRHLRKPWSAAHGTWRYSLWGRLYLRQRNYADAVIALDKQPAVAGDGLFDHYNFGIALLETGQRDRGLALIDEIGYLPMESEEHRVLRDRVNLSMGWYWLSQDQGGTAREYFRRVRLEGPHSSMALLGLGWAELTADGKPQQARFERRVLCEKPEVPPDALMRLLSDRYAACHPGEKPGVFETTHRFAFDTAEHGPRRYLEALRPWQVLSGRDAHDPAVQEALLAVGYALEKRQAMAETEQAYRLAVRRYEAETTRLAALEAALKTPESDPVTVVERQALPGEFGQVRGGHEYRQAMVSREALLQTERRLAESARRLEGKERTELSARLARLQSEVAAAQAALNRELRRRFLDDLATRRARLDLYHSRARLSLARLYDIRTEP